MNLDLPTTPEDFFRHPAPDMPRDLPVDAILRALDRANAMLYLLQGDGADINEGFTLDHRIVMDAVDAVQGLIISALRMVEYHIDVAC